MNYLIHATPVYPSLCLQYLILLFTIVTITVFTLSLLLLFYYYYHYKTVATDKPLRASLFPGAAELTTHLLRLINILWLPLCRINKFRFYIPQRLLRSPILVGHQGRGKKHGQFLMGGSLISMASVPTLPQIKARQTSSSPVIRSRPNPRQVEIEVISSL
jgi:uncharacterized membrane protein YbhN (UPF0104 family)